MAWGSQREKRDSFLGSERAAPGNPVESGAEAARAGGNRGVSRGQTRSATLRQILRTAAPSCESTKSAMRGAISARNRDPLNTP